MLTEADKTRIVDIMAHCGDGVSRVMMEFALGVDEIDEIMGEANYERCPDCEEYVEAGDLADENGDPRSCYSCEPLRDED